MTWKIRCRSAAILVASLFAAIASGADAQTPPKLKLPPASGMPAKPLPAPLPMQKSPLRTPASAAYVAQTQQPVTKPGMVSAGAISWQCQGDRCQANGAATAVAVNACRALALQVGVMRSFAIGGRQLDAAGLTQCNAGLAKSPAPTALHQIQKTVPGTKPGTVPDLPTSPEVWKPGGVANAPASKLPTDKPTGFLPKGPTVPTPPAPDASKKPSMGFAPKKPSGNGADTPATKPAARSYPVSVRTSTLTVTGIGRRETATDAERREEFRPLAFRIATLTVTGTGSRETVEDAARRAAFTPRSVRTPTLTVTGTGRRE